MYDLKNGGEVGRASHVTVCHECRRHIVLIRRLTSLSDHVDFNRSVGARRSRCGGRPAREAAVELSHLSLVLNGSLSRRFVGGDVHVDIVVVEDSEVLPVSAPFAVLHIGDEIAVDPRVTKPQASTGSRVMRDWHHHGIDFRVGVSFARR